MQKADSFEKTLMLGKIEGRKRRGRKRMSWLDGITNSMDMSLSKLQGFGDGQGGLVCCGPWGRKEADTTEQLNWNELICQEVMGLDAMILVFWMLSFKPAFLLFSSPSSRGSLVPLCFCDLGSVICISEMIDFFLEILIPACASFSLAFHMMYSAYKQISRVTIYNLDILLSQFCTSLLFHIWF